MDIKIFLSFVLYVVVVVLLIEKESENVLLSNTKGTPAAASKLLSNENQSI